MGSCSSAPNNDSIQINNTLNEYYAAPSYKRLTSKWNYFSHISNGSSSGVSSACNSPSWRNIFCRSTSTSPTSQANALRPKCRQKIPKSFNMLSICDDFGEGAKIEQRVQAKSFGYYSDSMSMQSNVSKISQLCLVRKQDTSLSPESPLIAVAPASIELEMEMYMMSKSQCLMPKTSSPIIQRKYVSFHPVAVASLPSNSYQKWANHLQTMPTHMLHNIADIPEAIAGHFSPLDFPAFTDLDEMQSGARKYKPDIHIACKTQKKLLYLRPISKVANATHTVTTEL